MEEAKGEEVTLFGFWSSPFVHRVIWALNIKKIKYKYVEEDLSNKSALLLEHNPVYKKVPVLVYNGIAIAESLIILEFIEETWKENSIMPQDPYEKAVARFWATAAGDGLWQFFITEGKEREEALTSVINNFELLEKELIGKNFFGGDRIGYLDISVGWISYGVPIFEEITEFKIITEQKFPLLHAWMEAFSNSEFVKDTLPLREKLSERYRKVWEAIMQKKN
ncbi:Glutathione S-transferase family protein [Rhynchospora pubera]|uniref:glutathione transferase n=1 Tax=Rhynchospora pubera TaxID=906938 RepID=A0AAV8F8G6_9POAL|nr:Glutathione S-transferase family protein [Rhynchospora pubera]